MIKRVQVVAVIGLALLAGAAWWWQNKPRAASESGSAKGAPTGAGVAAAPGGAGAAGGPVVVEVGKVLRQRIEEDAQAVGTLSSRQSVMLRPEVSGRISRIGFSDGQRVRRGQLLVQLDDSLQSAQLRQSEAQAGIARTNLQRNKELVSQNFVSQSVVDQSTAALEVAMAQVALSKA